MLICGVTKAQMFPDVGKIYLSKYNCKMQPSKNVWMKVILEYVVEMWH